MGPLPAWLPTELLGFALPLRVRSLRFGLERFRSTFTFASIGYVPAVVDSFLCDVHEDRGVVRFVHECKTRDIGADPFAGDPVLAACMGVLKRVFGLKFEALVAATVAD